MTDVHVVAAPRGGLRFADARAAAVASQTPTDTLAALRTVLLYTLADPFVLCADEIIAAGVYLDHILAPLTGQRPGVVPLAVRKEILDGTFSAGLDVITRTGGSVAGYDPDVTQASAADWVSVLMHLVEQCYSLPAADDIAMAGRLTSLLRDLGIGDPVNPRAAMYLPADVRLRISART